MNRSIIIGAFIISAAILVNGFLERRAHVGSAVSALVTPVASPDQTIAVLPCENLSRDPDNAYFAEGIRSQIVPRLAKQHVKAASVQEAPHTGVLVRGSVAKFGNQVRITVQLVDAEKDRHLWAETYDRELTDVFALQNEIAESVAEVFSAKKP